MRILIDINHPAQFHYFRNIYKELCNKHKFIFITKNIQIIIELMKYYDVPYLIVGDRGDSKIDKLVKECIHTYKMILFIKKNNIDIAMGVSAKAVHASFLFSKCDSIFFLDDDQDVLSSVAPYTMPFVKTGFSPDVLSFEKSKNIIYYPGYQELAYLHPKRFTPNPEVLEKYGLSIDDKYYILRFNAFKAHHDIHEGGMNLNQKRQLIRLLEQYGKVFITTEKEIDPEFEKYRIPIAPYEMHNFLAYSQMLVSDSQTMSSEAAVLGIPSYRCNTFVGRISYLEEEEKRYGLTYGYLPRQFDWMLEAIERVLQDPDSKAKWQIKRNRMLEDKIDVTAFWIWFIDNYPASVKEVKEKDFDFGRFK